jgi:enoyl-CoA hydratase/carnithine racemase
MDASKALPQRDPHASAAVTGRVLLGQDGPIACITIDNPSRYNAMTMSMWNALGDTIASLGKDETVRVIQLRGTGKQAFVSGADISEFEALRDSPGKVAAYNEAVDYAEAGLMNCSKPVVACIHGVCMGGGIGLALACDLRYTARNARFRMPAARIGLGYGFQGMRRMVDVIGAPRAAEIVYTARTFDGTEAERLGLVHQAYDAAELDGAVAQVLQQIAGNAPLTINAAKVAIRQALTDPDLRDLASVENAINACFGSSDYMEGRRAFTEKRTARFNGR